MKANKFWTILGMAAVVSTGAWAQESKKLSLQEAIDLSIKNNKQIRLNTARIQEATASLKSARANALPDVSISGSYLRLAQPTIDLKLKLGGSGGGQTDTATASTESVKVNEAMYGIANVSLPLFAGFKIQAGIESARYLEQAARLDAEQNREDVIQNTISAYSNLYKAREAVELVKESLKGARQRSADFSNLEKNGLMARNDLLKAQLQESNFELSLLDAESNVQIATVNMDLMLGLPESTLLIPDTEAFQGTASEDPKAAIQWETDALGNRKDVAALAARERAANAGIKYARSDYYPSLALTGGYVAAYIPNFLTLTNAVNAGIGLSYHPSSLWKNGSKVAEAKSRLLQVQINQSALDDQVRMQVNQYYQAYVLSMHKIEVYAKAVIQAEENYRITNNKYQNSLATTTDLLDADVAQLQARLNYAYSKADAAVAYKKLQQISGMLTATY